MFTLPHNTIAYLYKKAIDTCLRDVLLAGSHRSILSQLMAMGILLSFWTLRLGVEKLASKLQAASPSMAAVMMRIRRVVITLLILRTRGG